MAKRTQSPLPSGFREVGLLHIHRSLEEHAEQLYRWLCSESDFAELRIKARDDGSCIAIAKGYDHEGGPVVCFGTGYDPLSALYAVEGTIRANKWRLDKPWSPDGSHK